MEHTLPEPKTTGKSPKAKASQAEQGAAEAIQTQQATRASVVLAATARAAAVTGALGVSSTVLTIAI